MAATKSYTNELLALYLLVDAWRGGDAEAAQPVPQVAADVLDRPDAARVAGPVRSCPCRNWRC